MSGRAESGWIVWTPEPAMLKTMVSRPGLALACWMAQRS
jgi:hypothetical protein